MKLDPAVVSTQSPQSLFHELLQAAIAHQRAEVQEDTRAYLINLLSGFLESEAFLARDENGNADQRPLAFMLKDALEEEGPMRLVRLRKLGDTSLFVSGFLPESLARKTVGVDYYIAMGERAYDALGGAVARRVRGASELTVRRSVFEELAAKFKQLVELLHEVAERTWANTEAGLLRLTDRFLETGDLRLGAFLRGQGVAVPVPIVARPGRRS